MCDYCEGSKFLFINTMTRVNIDNSCIDVRCDDYYYSCSIDINYCPICGRKL